MRKISTFVMLFALLFSFAFFAPDSKAQSVIPTETRTITFPVIGTVTYGDDFGDAREDGKRTHEGIDLMGAKMVPLVAAVDGTVRRVSYPQADYGYSVILEDKDGYTYHYLHINNDTSGTDDGKGGGTTAYAVDIDDDNSVVAGQLIGWMGDSGNAEGTRAHLHFEIHRPDRTVINPYNSLKAAKKITKAVARPKLTNELLPFGEFGGGSFISAGNVDADNDAEILVAAGPGGGPHIQVLEQNGTVVASFFPYDKGFRGGVDVAFADIDGDNKSEIVTAPGPGGGPHVKIFNLAGQELGGFMAYDAGFKGGINLAAADLDGDGGAEIITAPGKGGGPHVRAFKQTGVQYIGFFAYDANFTAGIDISAYDSGGKSYIATAPGNGGGPHVKIFDNTGNMLSQFMAYDPKHLGGVRLTMAQTNNSDEPEIVTVPLRGGPHVRLFKMDGTDLDNSWGLEEWWSGQWDVASYNDETFIAVGPGSGRRASVREAKVD
jgi:hypothetical protein